MTETREAPTYVLEVDPAFAARVEEVAVELRRLLGVDIAEWSRLYEVGGSDEHQPDTRRDASPEPEPEEHRAVLRLREGAPGQSGSGLSPAGEPDPQDRSRQEVAEQRTETREAPVRETPEWPHRIADAETRLRALLDPEPKP